MQKALQPIFRPGKRAAAATNVACALKRVCSQYLGVKFHFCVRSQAPDIERQAVHPPCPTRCRLEFAQLAPLHAALRGQWAICPPVKMPSPYLLTARRRSRTKGLIRPNFIVLSKDEAANGRTGCRPRPRCAV